jgi:hypothetical protein
MNDRQVDQLLFSNEDTRSRTGIFTTAGVQPPETPL